MSTLGGTKGDSWKKFEKLFLKVEFTCSHFQSRHLYLAHITLGRKRDPFYINIRNPIPQKV